MTIVGDRIRQRREQLGYTQEELASFAEALDTSIDWLLGVTEKTESTLSEEERLLLNLYRSKSPDKKETLLNIARAV